MPRSLWASAVLPLQLLAVAAILVLLHIVFAIVALNGGTNSTFAYRKLFQGDGKHYATIATHGYFARDLEWPLEWRQGSTKMMKEKTNVAFFPAYPFFAHLVARLTGLTMVKSLLLASQLAAVAFWLYVLLLCRAFGASWRYTALALFLIAAFPSAFFLVTSMSESIFLASLLGMIYWSKRSTPAAASIAIVHGIVMTASRVFGVALVPLLLLQAWLQKKDLVSSIQKNMSIAAAALIGFVGFLLYCQWAFGHADLYFAAQREGWSVQSAPLFFLRPQFVQLLFPWLVQGHEYVDGFGQLTRVTLNIEGYWYTALILWWLALWPVLEWHCYRRSVSREIQERVMLYAGALISTYLMIVPIFLSDMQSAIRYAFLPHVFVVLTMVHWIAHTKRSFGLVYAVLCAGIAVSCVSMWKQFSLVEQFMLGNWVG